MKWSNSSTCVLAILEKNNKNKMDRTIYSNVDVDVVDAGEVVV